MNQIVDDRAIAVGSREGVNSKLSCGEWLGIKGFLVKTVRVRCYIWNASFRGKNGTHHTASCTA